MNPPQRVLLMRFGVDLEFHISSFCEVKACPIGHAKNFTK